LLQSIFRGKTSSQLICEQGCGSVKNRYEDFYNLSVEVNNMKTIYDSLEKFMSPEKIDEYNCETCKKKVTITKRNSLAELPNVLIIHLQRISYNYLTDRTEKINSKLEFPKILNLRNFTMEELARKAAATKSFTDEDELRESIENDEIYFRHNNYYEYFLTGVVVHLGSAEAGHYFSYINSTRGGTDHEPNANPNKPEYDNNWLKFNDSHISKFDISRLEEECFGGVSQQESGEISWKTENIQSAYMLVYERRLKSPLKIIVQPDKINKDNLIAFKEEEFMKMKKQLDLARYYGTNEFDKASKMIFNNYFLEAGGNENEYYMYKPYYSKERIIPKKYYLNIIEDNTLFEKQQIITDEQFVNFFNNVINLLDEALQGKRIFKKELGVKISTTFFYFIMNIISTKENQSLVLSASEKFIKLVDLYPESLPLLFSFINENISNFMDLVANDNQAIATANCYIAYELIKRQFSLDPKDYLVTARKPQYGQTTNDYLSKLIDNIIGKFPRLSSKLVTKSKSLYKLLHDICLLGNEILEYYFGKELIYILITFLLGRESPCYFDSLNKNHDLWDNYRPTPTEIEPIVDLVYYMYMKSNDESLKEVLINY